MAENAELNMMVLNRKFTLNTLKGHSVAFEKDTPIHVPRTIYNEALAIGAQPADGSAPDTSNGRSPDAPPMDPIERNPKILAAIETLVKRNDRKDFTAAGTPAVKAVERELGFDVDAREIASVWQERSEAAEANKGK